MRRFIASFISIAFGSSPVWAQVQLPGAFAPAPVGTVQGPAKAGAAKAKGDAPPVASAVRAPGEDAIIGRALLLNGRSGRIEFELRDKLLQITRLVLAGEMISKPADACEVNVVPGAPLSAKALGKPEGLLRYEVEIEACPFSFDVLEGGILAGAAAPVCEFKAADCKISPVGLWGPHPGALVGERLKAIEKARAMSESAVRANFRVLLARAHDKGEVKLVAREQAAFSSLRETTCRDYAQESKHGFCATRITEAHAAALHAKIEASGGAKPEKKPKKKRP